MTRSEWRSGSAGIQAMTTDDDARTAPSVATPVMTLRIPSSPRVVGSPRARRVLSAQAVGAGVTGGCAAASNGTVLRG
jgi:hypothetical protein